MNKDQMNAKWQALTMKLERMRAESPDKYQEVVDRFNSKVKVNEQTGCHEWQATRVAFGYGMFGFLDINYQAHRFAFALAGKVIPKDHFVCHHCDNPRCVNVDHLFPGTPKDNTDDCVSKKRHSHGVNHGLAKLTDEAVETIRTSKEWPRFIAKRFGITVRTVCGIRAGDHWKHVEAETSSPEERDRKTVPVNLSCVHCKAVFRYMSGRGLCHKCFSDDSIRCQYPHVPRFGGKTKKSVAEHAADVLRETGNDAVMWGDNGLVDMIAARAGVKRDGPATMDRVLANISKTPGELIQKYTRLGNGRLVRVFRLPEALSPPQQEEPVK